MSILIPNPYRDTQKFSILRLFDQKIGRIHPLCKFLLLLRCHLRKDFQSELFFSGNNTDTGSGFQSSCTSGMRDDNAFNVLNDISTDGEYCFYRHFAEYRTRHCCAVCYCNRLGAAHGWYQFLFQYINILTISRVLSVHFTVSFWMFAATGGYADIMTFFDGKCKRFIHLTKEKNWAICLPVQTHCPRI